MNFYKSDIFLDDAERQFRWYLVESGLDPIPALELAERFLFAVENTLEFLVKNPKAGRRRFLQLSDLKGFHSWRVNPPFNRFLIFYRIDGESLFAERLLEGHRLLAAEPN